MRALQSLIILFLCVASVFAQQRRVGTTGPEPPPLQGQGRWHYRAPLPHARSEVAVAEVSGKVYVIGGYADGFVDQPLNQEYDPAANTWRGRAPMLRGLNHVGALAPLPNPRDHMGLAVIGGKIYAVGGRFNTFEMAKELLPDALWARIAPLLPPEPPKTEGGRLGRRTGRC